MISRPRLPWRQAVARPPVETGSPSGRAFATLVPRARDGDREAFRSIYRMRFEAVARYVSALVGDPQRVEEVVAQTFRQAWRERARFDPRESFDRRLFRIAHEQAMRRDAAVETRPGDAGGLRSRREAGPRGGAELGWLHAGLGDLSSQSREVLVFRFLLGMRLPEIAAGLGKSEEAVRAIQHQALRQLQQASEAVADEDVADEDGAERDRSRLPGRRPAAGPLTR